MAAPADIRDEATLYSSQLCL